MLALFKEATSSVTLENVVKEHIFAATHTHSLKSVMEKTITLGKLEGSVKVHITIYIYYSMVMNVLFIYLFIYFAGTNIQTNEEVAIKLVSAFNQLGFVLY